MSVATLVRCAVTVIVGAIPVAGWFLQYNVATNGEALRVSYQALHGDGFNLGFGIRGFTGFNEQMQRVRIPVNFTPRDAVSHLLQRIAGINLTFFPYALLIPSTILFAAHRHRVRWLVVAVFAILPALYFFYWGSEIRFYSEFLPFLTVWIAAGALTVMRDRPRLGSALLAASVASSALLMVPTRWTGITLDEPWVRSAYTGSPSRFAAFETLDQMQRERGKLLVFVQEQTKLLDVLIDRLYLYNIDGLESPVLVVRDMGARNADVGGALPRSRPAPRARQRSPQAGDDHSARRDALGDPLASSLRRARVEGGARARDCGSGRESPQRGAQVHLAVADAVGHGVPPRIGERERRRLGGDPSREAVGRGIGRTRIAGEHGERRFDAHQAPRVDRARPGHAGGGTTRPPARAIASRRRRRWNARRRLTP